MFGRWMTLCSGGMKHLKHYNMTTQTKPNDVITGFNGLTKREYFAAMAMQAIVSIKMHDEDFVCSDTAASEAVMFADALINELNEWS